MYFYCIFLPKNLHNTKKSITFALYLKNKANMIEFTDKEVELIEAIRNFKASKGRMGKREIFEDYINQLVTELMEN